MRPAGDVPPVNESIGGRIWHSWFQIACGDGEFKVKKEGKNPWTFLIY